MRIQAFQGLRPDPERAPEVASLPYDVVSTEEARELAAGNPLSFLHVVRAEIDRPPDSDPYADAVYAKARENLERLQELQVLVREPEPCLYIYELEMLGRTQRGLVTVCHIGDYENDVIKKHEKTRKAKEDDRTKLNATLSAHPGPVFLTYRDQPEINALVNRVCEEAPFINFTAEDSVRHTIWRVPGGGDFPHSFSSVPVAYVADGHHRSASAARVGGERRANNPSHTGEEPYNWFLAVAFPASELNILAYNRVVFDLNGLSADDFLKQLEASEHLAEVSEEAAAVPAQTGEVCFYLDGKWRSLRFEAIHTDDPAARLDVARLQDNVLAPILGIGDPRTDARIDFVGGIRGTEFLEKQVDSGKAAIAFSMHPVTVDELMAIADAGKIMPPKSTWFEPKLRSGLFVHTF
ncbi:MAG: DUF1015 domain-containing protein [Opitutales bacterium]